MAVDRGIDPTAWEKIVYDATMPIVTQFDDGMVTWPKQGYRPTSSASAPTVVARMLEILSPRPGDTVLEIGPGSGYNTALLSEIVGPDGRVSTVEVDADVPAEAEARLDAGGYLHNVRVIVGDGATTTPPYRLWDRVIATAGVPLGRLPYGWVEHTRPGGVIVAPIFADLTSDPLVRLVVGGNGSTVVEQGSGNRDSIELERCNGEGCMQRMLNVWISRITPLAGMRLLRKLIGVLDYPETIGREIFERLREEQVDRNGRGRSIAQGDFCHTGQCTIARDASN